MSKYHFPQGHSSFQTFLRSFKLVSNPLEAIEESLERFGDTYSISNFVTSRYIFTSNPEFIEYVLKKNHKNYYKSDIATDKLGKYVGNGLLTSNGSYWLKQRRLIQPGFHIEKIKALYEIMKDTIDEFLKDFPTGRSIDVYPLMNRLAFDVVLNTLFNAKIPDESRSQLGKFISEIQEYVVKEIRQPHLNWWFILSGQVRKNLEKSKRIRKLISEIIDQRKKSDEKFNDLLDMLLEARYEDTGEPMKEHQLIDEIVILIIAGHETTANTLSWTLFLLAGHRDILKKLRVCTKGQSIEEISKDHYMNAVLSESLRLFPPAWITDRVTLQDDQWNEYSYPKGTVVVMYLYGLHRSHDHWETPEGFVPERFLKNNSIQFPTNTFYPFGAGPRLCIGNNFAMAEMAIFLQSFIQKFDIRPDGYTPKKIPLVTLRPDKVLLKIELL